MSTIEVEFKAGDVAIFSDRKPMGGGMMGWEVFDWIAAHLTRGKRILELGSGKGTIHLSKHWKVWSVEHDRNWIGKCKDSEYIYAPIVDGWYDRKVLEQKLPKEYDLLVIDGPPGVLRTGILGNLDLFDLSVPVVVDDVDREPDMRIARKIALLKNSQIPVHQTDYGRMFAGFPGS